METPPRPYVRLLLQIKDEKSAAARLWHGKFPGSSSWVVGTRARSASGGSQPAPWRR